MEPRLDVLESILSKYVMKQNYLVCREFVKNVIQFYSLNQYFVSFTWWVTLALRLLNRFVVLYFLTFYALNGFMWCTYYTHNIAMVLHYVEAHHNVQEFAHQYFVLISLLATVLYNTKYFYAGKQSAMYHGCLSLLCIYFSMRHST